MVFFGTYDTHRPRFRVLKAGLQAAGVEVHECHREVWGGVIDRSHLRSPRAYAVPMARWCAALPHLVSRYRRMPPHQVVVVPYVGHADVMVARLLARKAVVVFDPFVTFTETIVEDRKLVRPGGLVASLMRHADRLALRSAHCVLLDTEAHGRLMESLLRTPLPKSFVLPVGAEPQVFPFAPLPRGRSPVTVLFYGSMIPLHGVDTIVSAAGLLRSHRGIRFVIVGRGQEYPKARALAARVGVDDLIQWEDPVPYHVLPSRIAEADICLGIFGKTPKAMAVVPNKVYQALAVGRPVITADSPAAREWFADGIHLRLVAPGDPHALAESILDLARDEDLRQALAAQGHQLFQARFTPEAIGRRAVDIFLQATSARNERGRVQCIPG